MRRLLIAAGVALVIVGVGRLGSAERRGRWRQRVEAAVEHCPPIALLRRLEAQNGEVIALLREQNDLLRNRASADRLESQAA